MISTADAVTALKMGIEGNLSFNQVAEKLGLFKDDPGKVERMLDMLARAELVKPEEVPVAVEQQARFKMDALKALVASGAISDLTYQAAFECCTMIDSDEITDDRAVAILKHCEHNRLSMDDTLIRVGHCAQNRTRSSSR